MRSVVLERKERLDPHSRATLILPRTLEILRQWAVLDPLLAAGNRVPHVRLREPGNDHQILHVDFTKLADERFQTARPHRRVALVRALGALPGFGRSTGGLTRRFSMLEVPYRQSPLIHARRDRALGRRVPDVLTGDGERLHPRMASGAILSAGDPTAPQILAAELGLPLVDGDVAALTRFFGRDRYVALIRPDQIIGAIAERETPDRAQFISALGRRVTEAAAPSA